MPQRKPGPSVKDPKMYEALRDDGASKEKAARISNAAANTSRSSVGRKGGESGDYDDWTKDQLMKRAREIGIDDYLGVGHFDGTFDGYGEEPHPAFEREVHNRVGPRLLSINDDNRTACHRTKQLIGLLLDNFLRFLTALVVADADAHAFRLAAPAFVPV